MMLYVFIHGLTGRVFKALPLREAYEAGEEVFWKDYFHSLAIDAKGAFETFPDLQAMPGYITVVNTLQYLNTEPSSMKQFRKEIFGILSILNGIERQLGGDVDV